MNRKSGDSWFGRRRKLRNAALIAPLCSLFPLACDDDDAVGNPPPGGSGGASGSPSETGGRSATGGKSGDGGSGTGGGTASGGRAGSGASAGSGGARSSGGTENSGGAPDPDGSAPEAGPPDAGACSGDLDPTKANLCLSFAPETVTFQGTPDLDGKGTLIVTVFRTATPAGVADVLATKFHPAPPGASAPTVALGQLPEVGFSGLPETVYVQTRFVDNLAGLVTSASGLSYGMFVGGIELADGIRPPPTGRPALRKIDLKNGEETAVTQRLTALRKFTTNVTLSLPSGSQPADDAQGPLSVGVFAQRSAAGAPVFGGGELACVDMKKGPVPMTGFFYVLNMPVAGADVHFGGQLDDFAKRAITPPGAIVSFDSSQLIPADQTVHVLPGDYAVQNDHVALTFVLGGFAGSTPYACPVVDPGPDAGDGG